MAEGRKGKRPSPTQKNDVGKAGELGEALAMRGAWIREDGAICFGNECVVIQSRGDGHIDFEVDPTACGEEIGKAVLDAFLKNVAHQAEISIKLKPKQE